MSVRCANRQLSATMISTVTMTYCDDTTLLWSQLTNRVIFCLLLLPLKIYLINFIKWRDMTSYTCELESGHIVAMQPKSEPGHLNCAIVKPKQWLFHVPNFSKHVPMLHWQRDWNLWPNWRFLPCDTAPPIKQTCKKSPFQLYLQFL